MVLTLLAILIAMLVVLAAIGKFMQRRFVLMGGAGASAAMAVLALAAIVIPGQMTTLALSMGPWGPMHLAIDSLAASFLLLLSLAALACAVCEETAPLALAAIALIVLAADSLTLGLGLLLALVSTSWRLAIFAVACLLLALTPFGDFAAIRLAPPQGWYAAIVLILVLSAASAMALWQMLDHRRDWFAQLTTAAMSGYILIRVLLDLCGPTQPLWWSIPLLLLGAAVVIFAPLRAALADTLQSTFSFTSLHQLGMAILGLGVALIARAVDLPSMTSFALNAVWLSLVCQVLCGALLLLSSEIVENAAGTRRLDRLGGLIHGMPVTAATCLSGLFAIAILPPGLGFAAFWLLLQSLLAAARVVDFGLQWLIIVVAALTMLSVGLAALAAVRLFGVVFLGRPRTPRTAVAEDPQPPVRFALVGLAGLVSLLGLVPAFALLPASGWIKGPVHAVILRTGPETPGYSPLVVIALLALVAAILFRLLRSRDRRREPAWSGGSAAPPSWLPFGDPRTQYGPVSFAEPVQSVTRTLRENAVRCRDAVLNAAARLKAR